MAVANSMAMVGARLSLFEHHTLRSFLLPRPHPLFHFSSCNFQTSRDPGIFRTYTSVSTYKRLVNTLGTPRDSHGLREKLHAMELTISLLVKETVATLKGANETDEGCEARKIFPSRAAGVSKQSALKAAQSRQRKYAPGLPPVSSYPN